jgi:transcriptional regulator with XRE-family HTH domain
MAEDVPLGTLLRRHRRAAGMTLEELAETSGVSVRAISDMERGRTRAPQRRTLQSLVDALRLPRAHGVCGTRRAGVPRLTDRRPGDGRA